MRITVAGVPIDCVTFVEAVDRIVALASFDKVSYVITANPEMVVESKHNQAFLDALCKADLVVPDGIGLLAMAQYLEDTQKHKSLLLKIALVPWYLLSIIINRQLFKVLPQNVPGVDLVLALAGYAAQHGLPIALIGGADNERAGTERYLARQFPDLQVVTDPGAADVSRETSEEFAQLQKKLSSFSLGFIFVAFGHPKQELWIAKHRDELPSGVAVGVGGTFSYLSGLKRRAHPVIRKLGLEWLWRLTTEPSRLKRIVNAVVVFPYYVFLSAKSE